MLSKAEMLLIVVGLFKEQSFQGTTLRDIAKALDLSENTVSMLLGTRADMLWDIISRVSSLFLTQIRSLPRTIPVADQFQTLLYRHIEVMVQERNDVFVFTRDWMFLDPARRREIQAQRAAYEGYVCRILDEGAQQGVLFAPDVPGTCSFVLSALQWTVPWDVSIDTAAFATLAQRYCTLIQRALCIEQRVAQR